MLVVTWCTWLARATICYEAWLVSVNYVPHYVVFVANHKFIRFKSHRLQLYGWKNYVTARVSLTLDDCRIQTKYKLLLILFQFIHLFRYPDLVLCLFKPLRVLESLWQALNMMIACGSNPFIEARYCNQVLRTSVTIFVIIDILLNTSPALLARTNVEAGFLECNYLIISTI